MSGEQRKAENSQYNTEFIYNQYVVPALKKLKQEENNQKHCPYFPKFPCKDSDVCSEFYDSEANDCDVYQTYINMCKTCHNPPDCNYPFSPCPYLTNEEGGD